MNCNKMLDGCHKSDVPFFKKEKGIGSAYPKGE